MKKPTLFQSLIPIFVLIGLIVLNIIKGGDTLDGSNQLSMLLAAFVTGIIAIYNKVPWQILIDKISSTLASVVPSILILMMVGALSGAWMAAGVIPTMIYYGLDLLRPEIFLPATVIITAIISVATGSSWSTVATIGVALIGIGDTLGFSPAMSAGAIISGAYFGDKISPLSDTTNLAASVAKVDLFEHIKFMLKTTIPSILITIVIFLLFGLNKETVASAESITEFKTQITSIYNINIALILIPIIVVVLIVKKVPSIPVLMIGALLGIITAGVFQQDFLIQLNGNISLKWNDYYNILTHIMYGETNVTFGTPVVNELLSTGGIAGMMNTIWLIIAAMIYGGILEAGHFLNTITENILKYVKSRPAMVAATSGTCVLSNLTTSDQYISIILPGKMFGLAYEKKKYDPALLSRTLEDSATVTSVLIPWNTCGATQATILGVATFAYFPFAIFCWLSPLMTILLSIFNISQKRKGNDPAYVPLASEPLSPADLPANSEETQRK